MLRQILVNVLKGWEYICLEDLEELKRQLSITDSIHGKGDYAIIYAGQIGTFSYKKKKISE